MMDTEPEKDILPQAKAHNRPLAAFASFAFGLILMAAAITWVLSSYLGPVQIIEGTVDIAVEGSTQGGTGVRGSGARALDIILLERLSETPYQPTFRLSVGYFEEETPFRLGQKLPRGTTVIMAVRPGALAEALRYGEERHALEQRGEVYAHSIISPEWLVPVVRLQFAEADEMMTRDMNRVAIWIIATVIFGLGMTSVAAGRLYLKGII